MIMFPDVTICGEEERGVNVMEHSRGIYARLHLYRYFTFPRPINTIQPHGACLRFCFKL